MQRSAITGKDFLFLHRSGVGAARLSIRAVYSELDMSHRELAEGVGLGEVTISRYCTNTRQPSLEILNDLANFMKWMFGG